MTGVQTCALPIWSCDYNTTGSRLYLGAPRTDAALYGTPHDDGDTVYTLKATPHDDGDTVYTLKATPHDDGDIVN